MKTDSQMIMVLNGLLADELTAIAQYIVHRDRATVRGYKRFLAYIAERIADEEKHRDALVKRILELKGTPVTSELNPVNASETVVGSLANDLSAELGAEKKYNAAICLAVELGDNATREILVKNLADEDDHIRDIEAQQYQIADMGEQSWYQAQL